MKITFKKQDPKKIIATIQKNLESRELGKIVDFNLDANDCLQVTIKKMGTSQLTFTYQTSGQKMEWALAEEKIAFAHKAFRGEVMERLKKVVVQAGGEVIG